MKRIIVVLYEFSDKKLFQIRVQDYCFFIKKAIVFNSFYPQNSCIPSPIRQKKTTHRAIPSPPPTHNPKPHQLAQQDI